MEELVGAKISKPRQTRNNWRFNLDAPALAIHDQQMELVKQVLSYGGGTQTICVCVYILQGRLPKPDIIAIADTGRERSTTWKYLDAIVRPAMSAAGLEIYRVSKEQFACNWGRNLFATSGDLMIPAFTDQSGRVAKLSNFCSGAWKSEVIDRWISIERGITRSQYVKWIGFSMDESRRIFKMRKGKEYQAGLIRFPLLEVPTKRQEAIEAVRKFGWPEPPRSRCFDCPNQSDAEWLEVQQNAPQEFAMAIERDETMRQRDPHAWLHQSAKPLRTVNFTHDDLFSSGTECSSGECFV